MNQIEQKADYFFNLLDAGGNYSLIVSEFKALELLLLSAYVKACNTDEGARQKIGAILRKLVNKMREYEQTNNNYYFTSVKLLEIFCIKNEL